MMHPYIISPDPSSPPQTPDEIAISILNYLPTPTWIEDFSAVKRLFNQIKESGVQDFRAYFESHLEDVVACAGLVKIVAINDAVLKSLQVLSQDEVPHQLTQHFNDQSWPAFREELIALAEGQLHFESEINVRNLNEGERVFLIYLSVPPAYADTLERVVVSFANLTNRKQAENLLLESEERHRALFENSPVGIAVAQNGYHLYANPAYIRMFGFEDLADIVGMLLADRVVEEARELFTERNRQREQGLAVESRYELLALQKDGTIFPVELDITTINQENGLATLLFVQDITVRKRAEETEREQRLLAEGLRDISAAMNRRLDEDQILDSILDNVGKVLANDAVDILLINDKDEVHVVRQMGYANRSDINPPRSVFLIKDIPNFTRMLLTGQPVIVPDVRTHPDWVPTNEMDWVRSYAGIPIRQAGSVVGFISMNSTSPNFYQSEHFERLAAIADQVAIAFTNAHLVEELRQANVRLKAQLSQIEKLQGELREQAIRDPLTGLFNRRYLLETLTREIDRARRENWPVSVIVIDIDLFKKVNDAYGHKGGDLVLVALGDLLKNNTRVADIACRYGGEEFVIVMPKAYPLVAFERAEQIRIKFEMLRVPYEDVELNATISLGIAVFPLNGTGDDEVLIRADRALYQAKQAGRNRSILYQNSAMTSPFRK
jgi:diguanylate cyclase (GGDEF)-like protein/PAS domain S-box-containing protein